MAIVSTGTQTTNEYMKQTGEELNYYNNEIFCLIACKTVKLRGINLTN